MKKLILAATILTAGAMTVQTAKAGDCEWATVGKVLTGVAAAAIVINALDCQPSHTSVTYTYSAPCPAPAPVVCAPAPVVYLPRPIYVAPAPVVVYRAPVYYAQRRPAVTVNAVYAYNHSNGYRHHRR